MTFFNNFAKNCYKYTVQHVRVILFNTIFNTIINNSEGRIKYVASCPPNGKYVS